MRSIVALLIVLLCGTYCSGANPIIKHAIQLGEQTALFTQGFELWVESAADWLLTLTYPSVLAVDRPVWKGRGSGYESRLVQFEVNPSTLGVGQHQLELKAVLEGAQGILGLPLGDEYWLLPLNRPDLAMVTDGDGYSELSSEGWIRLEPGAQILLNGTVLERHELPTPFDFAMSKPQNGTLRWATEPFQLEAGENREVSLIITGPLPPAELELFFGRALVGENNWHLGNLPLTVSQIDSGEKVVISLPALDQGRHELRGVVRALLPAKAGTTFIRASLPGQDAILELGLRRDWFDFSFREWLEFEGENTGQPFLLPDGTIRYPNSKGRIEVTSDALAAVIPLANPKAPRWVGIPSLGSATTVFETDLSHFLLPILTWDNAFNWRFIAKSPNWLVDLTAQDQRVQGHLGALLVKTEAGRISLIHNQRYSVQKGGWLWWDGPGGTGGSWRSEDWGFSFEIPQEEQETPYYAAQYAREGWLVQVGRDSVSLGRRGKGPSWGVEFKRKAFWIQAADGAWRLDIDPGGMQIRIGEHFGPVWSIRTDFRRKWVSRLQGERLEIYALGSAARLEEGGIRLRLPSGSDPRHAVTSAAIQLKNGSSLFELTHLEGYRLCSSLACYVKGSVRGVGENIRFNWGMGLVFTPVPQLIGSVAWDQDRGLQLRAGVAVPLVAVRK